MSSYKSFSSVIERAIKRKGGKENLYSLLSEKPTNERLLSQTESYYLEQMTKCIFKSGFVWQVIDSKWPTFLQAFHDFDMSRLMRLSDDEWDDYSLDTRIVRHRQKIQALRHNLWFVNDTANMHAGFGQFLANWPKNDIPGLFRYLKQYGSRLGGNTGQYFLQLVGVDSFVLSPDVVLALKMHGLDIRDTPNSQKDMKLIQNAFNQWHDETKMPLSHLSMILAFSAGDNEK